MRLDLACVNNDTVSKRVPLMDPVLQCYQVWVLVGKSIVVVMSMRISLQSHTIIGHAILRWHCSVLWTVLVPLYDKQVFVSSCKHVSAPGALCAVLTRVIRLMLLFLLCACRFACGQWLPQMGGRACAGFPQQCTEGGMVWQALLLHTQGVCSSYSERLIGSGT